MKFATANKPEEKKSEPRKAKSASEHSESQARADGRSNLPRFLGGKAGLDGTPTDPEQLRPLPSYMAGHSQAALKQGSAAAASAIPTCMPKTAVSFRGNRVLQRAVAGMRPCNCRGQCTECDGKQTEADLTPGGGQALDQPSRRALEGHFGADLSHVQVHTSTKASNAAASLNALAYTVGSNIYFAKGMYAPQTSDGQRLLAHEVAHVVQQGSGKAPSIAEKLADGVQVGVPTDPLEEEAERAANDFITNKRSSNQKLPLLRPLGVSIQRSPGIPPKAPVAQPVGKAIRVEPIIIRDNPILLGLLPPDAIKRWQALLDDIALNERLAAQESAVNALFEERDRGDLSEYDFFRLLKDWDRALERIHSRIKIPQVQDEVVRLDPQTILSPDVVTLPAWNKAAEKAFREKLRQRFLTTGVVAQLDLKGSSPKVALWWGQFKPSTTNGYVTFANLLEFPDIRHQYEEEVQNSELVREVREGMNSVQAFVNHWSYEHHGRSAANYPEGDSFGSSVNRVMARYYRHTAELLGKGSAKYPPLSIWGEPRMLLAQAHKFFDQGQFEIAAAALDMASRKANDAASQFSAYESRIISGVERTVTVLKGLRFVGKVAATLIPGGSLFARAGYAAAYTGLQESGSHAAELALGQRESFGAGEIFKEAALEGVLSLLGDITVGQFTSALQLRFGERLAQEFGPSLSAKMLQTAAVATAAPWNAAASEVMNQIVTGKTSVKSLDDLGDLIISRVMQDTGMHLAMSFLPHEIHGQRPGSEPDAIGTRQPVTSEPTAHESETRESGARAPAEESVDSAIPAGPSAIPGHQLKVTPGGRLVRCTTCAYLAERYRALLDREPQLKAALESLENNAKKLGKQALSDRAKALEGAFILREEQMVRVVLSQQKVPEAQVDAFLASVEANPEQLTQIFDRLETLLEKKGEIEGRDESMCRRRPAASSRKSGRQFVRVRPLLPCVIGSIRLRDMFEAWQTQRFPEESYSSAFIRTISLPLSVFFRWPALVT